MKINKNFKVAVVGAMLVLTLGSVVGCSTKKEESPNNLKQTNQSEEASFKNIDGAKAEEVMKDAKDILILDVRDANEYSEGHIVDAINIPVDEVEKRISELEAYKDKPVLVYCRSGKRSVTASETLVKNGFRDVNNIEDGVSEYEYTLVK